MRGPIDDYRPLLARSFSEARERVFGQPEEARSTNLSAYDGHPVEFVREVLGQRTWEGSRAILRGVVDKRHVVICGGRKSTKTHTCAQSVCYFMSTAPTICVTTAAVATQVREVMWTKIGKIYAGSRRKLPGRMGVTSWHVENEWRAIGISTDKPGNIHGFHAGLEVPEELDREEEMTWIDPALREEDLRRAERDPDELIEEEVWKAKRSISRLLFVVDEMAEVRPAILDTLQGSWIGDRVFVLGPMNPTFAPDSGHPAAKTLVAGSGWHRIHISSEEIPEKEHPTGLFDECFHGVPEAFVPKSWIEKQEKTWTRGSALFECHVRGLPAAIEMERQFIPWRILRDQLERCLADDGKLLSRHIGWDVAASAKGDFNVVQLWVNGMLTEEERWHNPHTIASAQRVWDLGLKWGVGGKRIPGRNVHVDKLGVGKGPTDYLHTLGWWVDAVDFGGEAQGDWQLLTGDQLFLNRKAELLWVLRCVLERGIGAIPGLKNPDGTYVFGDTIRQAQWYTVGEAPRASGTAIKCAETREQIVELKGNSPDNLSAAMLAWSRSNRPVQVATFTDLRQLNARLRG